MLQRINWKLFWSVFFTGGALDFGAQWFSVHYVGGNQFAIEFLGNTAWTVAVAWVVYKRRVN